MMFIPLFFPCNFSYPRRFGLTTGHFSLMYFFQCIQVGNLAAPVEEWTVGGTALTALMDVERRHGIVA